MSKSSDRALAQAFREISEAATWFNGLRRVPVDAVVARAAEIEEATAVPAPTEHVEVDPHIAMAFLAARVLVYEEKARVAGRVGEARRLRHLIVDIAYLKRGLLETLARAATAPEEKAA